MWYICPPLEADIIFVDDEGYLIHLGQYASHLTGNTFPVGQCVLRCFQGVHNATKRNQDNGAFCTGA
ncbi:hypothetical protein PSI19_20760 [Xenorhabdus khoisanae]|uniref:hypothetical protein n=1 Tax=Xenorhabdus khoisanae TaxID=880157 RepID=UPI002359F127|nr:hypothetical protein [Xenorhabdus khoisanae]MDC9616239.1 hypothetical protein [Xenorhabdus khoisanae]